MKIKWIKVQDNTESQTNIVKCSLNNPNDVIDCYNNNASDKRLIYYGSKSPLKMSRKYSYAKRKSDSSDTYNDDHWVNRPEVKKVVPIHSKHNQNMKIKDSRRNSTKINHTIQQDIPNSRARNFKFTNKNMAWGKNNENQFWKVIYY